MARARGSKWQADATVDGKRKRVSFDTKAEAEAWEKKHAEVAPPAPKTPDVEHTLLSYTRDFGAVIWGVGDQGVRALAHVKELVAILGEDLPLRRFGTSHVITWTAALMRAGNSDATINRKYASVSKLCKYAADEGKTSGVPKFKRRPEPKGRDRFLSMAEEKRLFEALGAISQDDQDIAVFLVDTGARLGEAFSLQHYQIDFDATVVDDDGEEVVVGSITFDKTKADITRTVYMTSRVRALLERRKNYDTPFGNVNRWVFRDHWNRARKAAGFEHDPNVVPHILRHTCASRIVKSGLSLKDAQTQLGHAHPNMTNRYAHLATDASARVVRVLDRRA